MLLALPGVPIKAEFITRYNGEVQLAEKVTKNSLRTIYTLLNPDLTLCIFRANMADNINTPGVATRNEGKFERFYVLFRLAYMARL